MWDFVAQPGIVSAVVEFTNELSLLIVGLVGLVWLSAGAIVVAAIHYYLSQKTKPAASTTPFATDHREAA